MIKGCVRRLRETGSVLPHERDDGRLSKARDTATNEAALDAMSANPDTSTMLGMP